MLKTKTVPNGCLQCGKIHSMDKGFREGLTRKPYLKHKSFQEIDTSYNLIKSNMCKFQTFTGFA